MKNLSQNREAWLSKSLTKLEPIFKKSGHLIPPIKVSVGFTNYRGDKKNVLGACWKAAATEDNSAQIFIVPTINDSVRILDILAHEICHSILPEDKHNKNFKKLATSIGLTGRMTATIAGPELTANLNQIIEEIGEYPHAKLLVNANKAIGAPKKQNTRMIKLTCDCGYTVRTSRKWLDAGLPTCHCGEAFKQN